MLTYNTIKESARYKDARQGRVFTGPQLKNLVSVRVPEEDGPNVLFLDRFSETEEPATLPDSEFGLEEDE